MIDLRSDCLDEIRSVLEAQAPDCEAWAFGSRVSGAARAHSDLDLVLRGPAGLGLGRLTAIREAFAESDLPIMVDVLDWHTLSESFRKTIEKNCELLRRPGR
ncbi:nucleotidyltransferase domain-containing protein [bacterium]|nr:nucleotidyltransferase domain-containing protein [bacterium]